mgnify:CR=1 FL=1|jgi:hypothetical protein
MTLGGILLGRCRCEETPDVDVHGSKDFDYIKWLVGFEITEILSYKIEKKVKNC